MQHLVQIVGRGFRIQVGPQQVVHPVPVQPVVRCQGQQFQDAPGLAQPPRPGGDVAVSDRHVQATEQIDAHLVGHVRP